MTASIVAKLFPVKYKFGVLWDLTRLGVLVVTFTVDCLQISRGFDSDISKDRAGADDFVIRNVTEDVLIAGLFGRHRIGFLDVLNGANEENVPACSLRVFVEDGDFLMWKWLIKSYGVHLRARFKQRLCRFVERATAAGGVSVGNDEHDFPAIAFTLCEIRSSRKNCVVKDFACFWRYRGNHADLARRHDSCAVDDRARNGKRSAGSVRNAWTVGLQFTKCLHRCFDVFDVFREVEHLCDELVVTVNRNLVVLTECSGQRRKGFLNL